MNLIKRIFLTTFFFLLIGESLLAQKMDSVSFARNRSLYFYDTPNSFNFPDFQKIDTVLKGFQQYNPIFHNDMFSLWSGNIGGAYKSMVFDPIHSTGIDYGIHSFDKLLYNNYANRYYQLRNPFSEIYYVSGPQKEDILKIVHSQNITKLWNVTLDMRIIDSWGTYIHQATDNSNLTVNTNYFSQDKRYRLLASYYHNRITLEENGGLHKDSLFENNSITQRLAVPVNLSYAQNEIVETGIFVKQFLNLKREKQDSTKSQRKGFFNPGEFSYAFSYLTRSYTFTDDVRLDTNYFNNIYVDSVTTHDSVTINRIENNFAWSSSIVNTKDASNPFRIIFGLKHLFVEIKDTLQKRTFSQFIPYGSLSVIAFKKFHLDVSAEYVFGTHNESDFSFKSEMKYDFIKNNPGKSVLAVSLNYTRKSADWFYQEYASNNFKWTKIFNKEDIITTNAMFKTPTFKVAATYHLLGNHIYMNNEALPAQSNDVIHVFKAQLTKHVSWKFLEIDNNVIYQKSSDDNVIKLPKIIAMQSWYFNLRLFKRNMYMQPGVDLYYNTAYYADIYMPATRMFHIQNKVKTGDYVYCDLFINFQIKRANIFVKYQHLNAGMSNYNYYQMPHYPAQDGALKLGIQWRFWD